MLKTVLKIINNYKEHISSFSLIQRLKKIRWQYGATIFGIAIIIVVGIIYIFNKPAAVEAEWWNDGWRYRQTITITNGGSAQTDFQVVITADTAALVTAGKLQSDCDDIRLTDINGNVLPYWVEDATCNTSSTEIWVKLSSIPTTATTLYLYYDNPSAVNAEEGSNVFIYFDDFEDAGLTDVTWTGTGTGFTVTGGQLYHSNTLEPTNNWPTYTIDSSSSFDNGVIESKMKPTSCGSSFGKSLVARYTDDNNLYIAGLEAWSPGGETHIGKRVSGTWTNLDKDTLACSTSTWYDLKWTLNGTSQTLNANAATSVATDSSFSSGKVGVSVDNKETATGAYWEFFLVRKYAATEPSASSPTSEEKGPSPIAYWKFDEGYGVSTSSSVSTSNDGSLVNGVAWQTEDMCISGKCLHFDGVNDDVALASNVVVDSQDWSIGWWMRRFEAQKQGLFSRVRNASNGQIEVTATDGIRVESYTNNIWSYVFPTGIDIDDGQWHHYELTFGASLSKLYVDGSFASQASANSDTADFVLRYIGTQQYQPGYGVWFNGFMDEVKIYDYERTATQVKADYAASQSGSPSSVGASFGGGQQQNNSVGLVGYWNMDEASGSVLDSSGNGNTGTVTGTTVVVGKYGNGRSFNGTVSDYITIADNSIIKPTDAITVEAWFNTTNKSATSRIISKTESSGYQLSLNENSACGSDYLCFLIYVDGDTYRPAVWPVSNLNNNQWYHAVGTYDGNDIKLYVDGDLKDVYTKAGTIKTSTVPLCIGSEAGASCALGSYFPGKIDDVKIYNVARTGEQIMRDYKTGPPPIVNWTFEENTGTTLFDHSGNGHNSTSFAGDPTWELGKYGSSLNFDGNDYITLASNNMNGARQGTWTFWVKWNHDPTSVYEQVYIQEASTWIAHYTGELGIDLSDGAWFDGSGGNTTGSHFSQGSFTDLNWHHVSFVWDGTYISGYLDGIKNFGPIATTGVAVLQDGSTPRNIGYRSSGNYLVANLDDFKIYNYARTQEQILWDMYGDENNHPIRHLKFDEKSGGTTYDYGVGSAVSVIGVEWKDLARLGGSIYFDGTNDDSVNIVDVSPMENFSLATWVYNLSGGDSRHSMLRNYWEIVSTQVCFFSYSFDNDYWRCNNTGTIPYNEWTHVVTTWDGVVVRHFINGELSWVDTSVSGGTSETFSEVGGYEGRDMKGYLDEFKIFNYTLSPEQVRQEYNMGGQVSLGKQKESSETWDAGGFGGTAPIAYWNFEEGSGSSLQDVSSNNHTGTIVGAVYGLGHPGWALDFDRSGDYVTMTRFTVPTGVTIESWMKTTNTDSTASYAGDAALNIVGDSTGGVFLGFGVHGGKARYNHYSGSWQSVTGATTINDGLWHQIVATHNQSTGAIVVYVDGMQDATGTIGYTTNSGIDRIGAGYNINDLFDGSIDEVKIFNYVRSAAQIAYDYNGGKPIGWWPLDDNEGVTAIDISGNGKSGTLTLMNPSTDWISGKYGGGLDFDGTDGYVDVVGVSIAYTQDFTFTGWAYIDNLSHTFEPMMSDNNSQSAYTLYPTHAGKPLWYHHWDTSPNYKTLYGSDWVDTGWHHVAVSRSGTTYTIFQDGYETNSSSWSSNLSLDHLVIGGNAGSRYYNGELDDIRIYNYALTVEQIKEAMNNGSIYIK
ncbi:MAG: DUF2341 domain-containing protein [Candidatus Komeilibacteria bacterium]